MVMADSARPNVIGRSAPIVANGPSGATLLGPLPLGLAHGSLLAAVADDDAAERAGVNAVPGRTSTFPARRQCRGNRRYELQKERIAS